MFNPTYLYVKIHNKTGLKYFGKTVQDPFKYKGSGMRWMNHIKKHGYDVTTEIVGYYTNEQECFLAAQKFSDENKIVESKEWANIVTENLSGGAEPGKLGNIALQKRLQEDENFRNSLLETHRKNAYRLIQEGKLKPWKDNYDWTGKKHKEESKIKIGQANSVYQKGEGNSCYGLMWITDGFNSTRIKKTDEVPVGWRKGRVNGMKKGVKTVSLQNIGSDVPAL